MAKKYLLCETLKWVRCGEDRALAHRAEGSQAAMQPCRTGTIVFLMVRLATVKSKGEPFTQNHALYYSIAGSPEEYNTSQ